MKVLVTGAGGFIGSHVAEQLACSGYEVRALSRQVPISLIGKEIEIRKGDIAVDAHLEDVIQGVDAIIHSAALLAARTYSKETIFRINYESTVKLLQIALRNGVKKIVHLSTGGVLGDIKNPPADETAAYHPEDLYEESKMLAEQKVLEYASLSLSTVVVRPTWSYGERDKRVFKLVKQIKTKRFMKIGKCSNVQHPVYISDLVAGIILALEKGKSGSVYFIGGNEIIKTSEIIDTIASLVSVKLFPFTVPIFPMKIAALIMDKIYGKLNKEAPFSIAKLGFFIKSRAFSIKKAQSELGYEPQISFIDGMKKTIQWYQQQHWLL